MDGVVLDEAGDPVEGGVAFVEDGGECLEDVRDAGGDVQDDRHIVGCGLAREAGGVVEEHLVRCCAVIAVPFTVADRWLPWWPGRVRD